MADKRLVVSAVSLKGPTGSVTTDKRIIVSQIGLHGQLDKRLIVSKVTVIAPPPDLRIIVSRVLMVGPSSPPHAVYYGKNGVWVPVDLYLPSSTGAIWQKVG